MDDAATVTASRAQRRESDRPRYSFSATRRRGNPTPPSGRVHALSPQVERLMSTDRVLGAIHRADHPSDTARQTLHRASVVGPVIVMFLVGFSLYEQRAVLDRVAASSRYSWFFTKHRADQASDSCGRVARRERSNASRPRLGASFDIMLGYMIGLRIFAIVQTAVILAFTRLALQAV